MSDDGIVVTTAANGPLLISGRVVVRDSAGEILRETDNCALCRCGHSGNKPFCDGTHKSVGFESP